MDPVSALLAIAFVFGIIRGLPAVIDELREAGLADADAARVRRLTEAGITPARRGGTVGRYLGNLWREHVTGRGQRADKPTRPGSLRQRLADTARRWSERWRGGDGTSSPRGGRADGTVVPTTIVNPGGGASAPRQRDPIRAEATVDRPSTPGPGGGTRPVPLPAPPTSPAIGGGPVGGGGGGAPTVDVPAAPASTVPAVTVGTLPPAGDPGTVAPAGQQDPIRATATVATPTRGGDGANAPLPALPATTAPQQITGGPTMSGVVEVSGVSSGLAAAQAIQVQVQAAVEQFEAAMAAVDTNLAAVQDGAAGLIQFDGRGEVMQALAAAREAAIGAKRYARGVAELMTGFLTRVASAFRRRL